MLGQFQGRAIESVGGLGLPAAVLVDLNGRAIAGGGSPGPADLLGSSGLGAGTTSLGGADYSGTPGSIYMRPSTGPTNPVATAWIYGCAVFVHAAAAHSSLVLGAMSAVLTNGIQLRVYNVQTTESERLLTIKANLNLMMVASQVHALDATPSFGRAYILDFVRLFGAPIEISSARNEQFEAAASDDLSTLPGFHVAPFFRQS